MISSVIRSPARINSLIRRYSSKSVAEIVWISPLSLPKLRR